MMRETLELLERQRLAMVRVCEDQTRQVAGRLDLDTGKTRERMGHDHRADQAQQAEWAVSTCHLDGSTGYGRIKS